MPTLVLMRHGATVWGEENRFAGWADTPLSEAGFAEAERAAQTLKRADLAFDLCLTSRLTRATQSLDVIKAALQLPESTIQRDWRLNERHYGALQGETRSAMVERHGNAQVVAWRRSYDRRPPFLDPEDARWQEQIARFPDISEADQPCGESLADAVARVGPVWLEVIAPVLRAGKCVLVVAHTSPIRALARVIEGLDDEQSAAFRIATAIPIRYELDEDLRIVSRADLSEGLKSGLRYWSNRLKPRAFGGL